MINRILLEEEEIKREKKEKRKNEKEKTEKQPVDASVKLLLFQSGVVAAVLVICLIIKSFFGGSFEELKNTYDDKLNLDTNVNTVIEGGGVGGPDDAVTTLSSEGSVDFITPVKGTVTSKYGIRIDPFTGKTAFHSGVDIGAALNSEILAAAGGVVTKKAYLEDYGNYLIISHGGFSTLYAHCNSILVEKGNRVEKGQLVARVGSTGRSTGPHLHFEIRIRESRIDPLPFLNFGENK